MSRLIFIKPLYQLFHFKISLEIVGIYIALVSHHPQSIGQLDLPAFSRPSLFQDLEHFRRDHIPPQSRKPAGRLAELGLFHHVLYPKQVFIPSRLPVDDPVGRYLFRSHHLASNHRSPGLIILVHQLLQSRFLRPRIDHIIPQDHPERLPIDEILGTEDGIPQPSPVRLPGVMDVDGKNLPDLLQ